MGFRGPVSEQENLILRIFALYGIQAPYDCNLCFAKTT
jgi:hypothetical protein